MAEAHGSITHFSHPGHELVKRPFLCDMCCKELSGLAYGCRAGCNFAIHDACAGHPQTLFSPANHPHQLVLAETRRDVAHGCDVCAAGCFLYRCPPCGFDMHPRCALHHVAHDLALVAGEGRCAACRHGGRAWYYRCTVCVNVDLHDSCAAAAGEEEDAGARHGHALGAGRWEQCPA